MSIKKRGRIEFRAFPVWNDWANKVINELPNGGRKGVPRGERIPFDLKKSACGLLATIYPRGIKTTKELGGFVGISGDLIRKWRREAAFQSLVQDLEVQFATYVLTNLKDEDFFRGLYDSYWEPYIWGDITQNIFCYELMPSLSLDFFFKKPTSLKKNFLKIRGELRSNFNYNSFPIELPHSNVPFLNYAFQSLSYDLAMSALDAQSSSRRKIRGKRPQSEYRFRTVDSFQKALETYPGESLTRITGAIERLIIENYPKEDILLGVKVLKQTIELLYPQEAGMGLDENTTV